MKKILSLVLVVAMLATLVVFAPAAGAEEAYATVKTTNAAGAVGSTVTVDVIVTAPNTDTAQLNFHYDRSRLELVMTDDNLNAVFHGADVSGSCLDNGAMKEWNGDNGVNGDYYALFENITASFKQAQDLENYKLATITFKIKDDAPLGDAYVEFCNVGDMYTYVATGVTKHYGDEIAYTSSVVSVLPEGTIPATPTPESDFTVKDNGDGTCAIKTYNGDASVVVVPSTIDGKTVIELQTGAFKAKSMNTLVIPATVTTIQTGAAGNCNNMKDVYILGSNVTMASAAIGWSGEYKSILGKTSFTVDPEKLHGVNFTMSDPEDMDTYEIITTIHGVAGSSVQSFLAGNADELIGSTIPFVALTVEYIVNAGNMAYLAPANTKAPGQTVTADGKTVLTWKNGEETVLPGADLTLTGDTTLTVGASVALPATARDYSMKLSPDTAELGMRFTSTLSHADYEAMAKLGTVKLGMLITPNAYVERAGAFTKEALNKIGATKGAYVDVAIGGYYKDDGTTYTLAASLVGFSTITLAKNPAFAAVTYAEIDVNGDKVADITVYGQYDLSTVRTVKDVATKIHAEVATDTQKPWLEALLAALPQ